jgi:hypothetical protein
VRNHERGTIYIFDDIRDRKSFSRTRDAEQCLVLRAGQNAGGQFLNRLRLVAGGRIFGNELKHAAKLGVHFGRVKQDAKSCKLAKAGIVSLKDNCCSAARQRC